MAELQYFGTDGIRGTAGQHPMTVEFVFRLGYAAGIVLSRETLRTPVFLIGRDTRASGPALLEALSSGLNASGVRVIDLGILPTPGIAFLTRKMGATAGAVISASHNPARENGIKFLNQDGMKLNAAQELAIEAEMVLYENTTLPQRAAGSRGRGDTLYDTYRDDLLATEPRLDLSGKTLVVDCANGAAYRVAPDVLGKLGAKVIPLNTLSDGASINVNAGSENVRNNPASMASIVRDMRADAGIAFDGDADRVIMVDETGRLLDGDHMLAILASALHSSGRLLGDSMVTTVMANGALANYAKEQGFNLQTTPVGDKYVTEALQALAERRSRDDMLGLGGEQSGHVVILDECHRTGDGLRTALFMLKVMMEQPGQSLAGLADKIQKFPQVVASANVANKFDLARIAPLQERLEALKRELPGLVEMNSRYSGTEPKYRLMLETDTRHTTRQVANAAWEICEIVQQHTGTAVGAKIEVLNVSEGGLMPKVNTGVNEENQ